MSLFDRIARDPAPAAGNTSGPGLFGGANAAAPSQPASSAGNLFGGLNSTSQPAPTGASLFSNPSGTSDSSNATATQGPTTTASSGLFGNLAVPKSTTSGSPSNSLFGNMNKPNTTGPSLFGATSSTPTTGQTQRPADNGSVFGDQILPSSKLNEMPSLDRTSVLGESIPQPGYFQALLERGNKRRQTRNSASAIANLPQLELGLGDISRKVRHIVQGIQPDGATVSSDARSRYVLAASGVNTNDALRDVAELGRTIGGAAAPSQHDYGLFTSSTHGLHQFHQNNFEKMIQDRINLARVDFDKMIDEKLHYVDWEAHRQRIHEHFGLRKPTSSQGTDSAHSALRETGGFGRASRKGRLGSSMHQTLGVAGLDKSIIGTPGARGVRPTTFADVADKIPDGFRPAPEDRVQRLKQEQYANRVKDLNVARLAEKVYPIFERFSEVEAVPSNEDTTMLVHAYKALAMITGEDASKVDLAEPGVVRERQFAKAYLDESPSLAMRKRIIDGSRRFLENSFYSQAEATVAKNPKDANVGGVPTAVALIKGYVRVRAVRRELGPNPEMLQELNGDYCWPVIFYMLRCGLYQESLDYLEENHAAFRQIDRSFMRYLRAFVSSEDRRLPTELQTSINNEYTARQRLAAEDSVDPYRMICYKVIGRCDLGRRTLENITNDMMDWMWLQFALACEYSRPDEFAYEAFGLEELRRSVKDIGARYFGPGNEVANGQTTLFFMQVLCGMFEKAVADLYPHNYVSAVHFAIALDFYGLLRVSDISNSDDLITYTTRQEAQIAFGLMIGLYTRDFRTANATAAIEYLTFICLNDDLTGELGKVQRDLCHQAITEVVLETREFAQLLGDVRADGVRIRGAVEQRLRLIGIGTQQEFLKHITLVAARMAEEQSRVTDAALLFHLAEDYDKVIHVVNEAVSLSLTTEIGSAPIRLTPLKPRNVGAMESNSSSQESQPSLSLTAIDDPFQLARGMVHLYDSKQMYSNKIKKDTWDACHVLLQLSEARSAFEQNKWSFVIDSVSNSNILPTNVSGANISAIRTAAQGFDQMPVVISRAVGHVMIWIVVACTHQLEHLRRQEFETGARHVAMEACVSIAKNIMVFAGLIRYKLPGRVWEILAQAGQDLGVQ